MSSLLTITPAKSLQGEIPLPGDKSISHRAIILTSIARGISVIKGWQKGKDCLATLSILKMMGIEVREEKDKLIIKGRGLTGLKEPTDILNCENSGTTMRLLAGLLSAQGFYSVLSGDSSLRRRPMRRVISPLERMGAKISGRKDGQFPPLTIIGSNLKGIDYSLPIASAQVKSCLLLAGLYARGTTSITEPYRSRDHTERMLKFLGVKLEINHLTVKVEGGASLIGREIYVPGDISAAAFFIGGGAIIKNSQVKILNMGLNPTRRGFIDVLLQMGADIRVHNLREKCGEEIGDIEIKGGATLKGILIRGEMIPRVIDEIPILAVVACFARGKTVIKDAAELRVKETDRIKAITMELRKMGAQIEEKKDGIIIEGTGELKGCQCQSYKDHRIAMALVIAGLAARGKTEIVAPECIETSFPGFEDILRKVVRN